MPLWRRYIADLLIDVIRDAAHDVLDDAVQYGGGLGEEEPIPPLPPPMLRDVAALDVCQLGRDLHRSAVVHEVRAHRLLDLLTAGCRGMAQCPLPSPAQLFDDLAHRACSQHHGIHRCPTWKPAWCTLLARRIGTGRMQASGGRRSRAG